MITSHTETSGKVRQRVQAGPHSLHADLLPASGGEGSAPGPHDYFDLSLATCKALTAHVYARAHGLALDLVTVVVESDASHERQGTYSLDVKVSFEGALSDADKEKIHHAIEHCPVHKLMTTTTIEIKQTLV
jgi:putative redox protein